jgi:hypothetical protein
MAGMNIAQMADARGGFLLYTGSATSEHVDDSEDTNLC